MAPLTARSLGLPAAPACLLARRHRAPSLYLKLGSDGGGNACREAHKSS